jgi:CheY-like chemotaxis protein
MTLPRALVVDDDQDILEDVQERLRGIQHGSVMVSCLDDARAKLEAGENFDYVLLDLEIPTRYGKPPMTQQGLNLLSFINQTQPNLPVVVMTAHGHDSSDLPAEVMRHGRAFDYLRKPFARPGDKHRTLEIAAKAAYDQRVLALSGPVVPVIPLQPFAAAPRELVIEGDCITLCGIEVWCDRAQDDLRAALELLAKRTRQGQWPRVRGPAIHKALGRELSNPISKPIQRFRTTCTDRMRELKHLDCGKFDVIADCKGGGYHLGDAITVVQAGSASSEPVAEPAELQAQPAGAPAVNPYQAWILAQLDAGVSLRQKDVVEHFARDRAELPRRDESSIKRYLKELRDRGMIVTGVDRTFRRATCAKA